MTWFMGTGITASMLHEIQHGLDVNNGDKEKLKTSCLSSWSRLIGKLESEFTPPTKSDDLLERARIVRGRYRAEKRWPEALTSLVRSEIELISKYNCPPQWQMLIDRLNALAARNAGPLLVTTNYDDLLSRWLDSPVLFRRLGMKPENRAPFFGRENEPGTLKAVPVLLREINSEPELWRLHEKGWLGLEERFVHHLHGWWADGDNLETSSVVFDPGDYRQKEINLVEQLAERLQNELHTVIFIGAGEGVLDPHLMEYWFQCDPKPDGLRNYWLLFDEDGSTNDVIRRANEVGMEERVTIVRMKTFDQLCPLLIDLLPCLPQNSFKVST